MKKIIAFDNTIYKFNLFDDGLTIPDNWVQDAVGELTNPIVLENQSCNLDKGSTNGGMLWSTFEAKANSFFSFSKSDILFKWVEEKIILLAPALGFNSSSVKLTIDWMNIMYKGSFGNCHTHDDVSELTSQRKVVAIFYLRSPENSSDLLVIKNTQDYSSMGVSPFTIPTDEIFPIQVTTGDLLIHTVDLPHAMSVHQNSIPRLVVVMEFEYNE
jgi:hypothetical protein